MSDSQPGTVQVTIYDREYLLRTSGDPARLQKLCADLDGRMREVAKSAGAVDTLKVAILAAISLGDDLLRARDQLKKMDESVGQRARECVSILDRFLY